MNYFDLGFFGHCKSNHSGNCSVSDGFCFLAGVGVDGHAETVNAMVELRVCCGCNVCVH